MGRAYYNEIDPAAVAILNELVASRVIAPGDVDNRSIKDVTANDVRGYTQCHFFAGGGLWSVAARLAGWPNDRELWTGSCPCQPFSSAGKGLGTDDARHLWPDFHRLIGAARPAVVMGEQVAGAAGYGWLDGVRADLAGEAYACRAVDIPACAIDAPHQRNRLYWLAVANGDQRGERRHDGYPRGATNSRCGEAWSEDGHAVERAHAARGLLGHSNGARTDIDAAPGGPRSATGQPDGCILADADSGGRDGRQEVPEREQEQRAIAERAHVRPGRNGSWWADAEWIVSPLDGKARRTKPGLPFLVDGLPGRVDLWRVGGNAISPILAAEVIAAFLDAEAGLMPLPGPVGGLTRD